MTQAHTRLPLGVGVVAGPGYADRSPIGADISAQNRDLDQRRTCGLLKRQPGVPPHRAAYRPQPGLTGLTGLTGTVSPGRPDPDRSSRRRPPAGRTRCGGTANSSARSGAAAPRTRRRDPVRRRRARRAGPAARRRRGRPVQPSAPHPGRVVSQSCSSLFSTEGSSTDHLAAARLIAAAASSMSWVVEGCSARSDTAPSPST